MFGYVYKTTNKKTGEVYIGQKKSNKFIPSYHGSGNNIKEAMDEYGKENFITEIIETAESKEELNNLEIKHIAIEKENLGSKCINIAIGGLGGNVFAYANENTKKQFVQKMTDINRARCSTDEFKENARKNMINRYKDQAERDKQSERMKKLYEDQAERDKQSERMKKSWAQGKFNPDQNNQRCSIEYGDLLYREFNSITELKNYMAETLNYHPSNPAISKMLTSEEPYVADRKTYRHLDGLTLHRLSRESVQTRGDECNLVGWITGIPPQVRD